MQICAVYRPKIGCIFVNTLKKVSICQSGESRLGGGQRRSACPRANTSTVNLDGSARVRKHLRLLAEKTPNPELPIRPTARRRTV